MKNSSLLLSFFLLINFSAKAQLEKVVVEAYYVSDSLDATDTIGGGLPVGSVTYRIYVDLVPGSQLKKVYGDANHALKIKSTAPFFNNKADGQSFGYEFSKSRLKENTVALDTWLTIGQTTKASSKVFGVLKSNDYDGSFIAGNGNNDGGSAAVPQGLLTNNDPLAGLSLINADGMQTMSIVPANWGSNGLIDALGNDSTIFGSLKADSVFISYDAGLQNSGVGGVVADSNQVLVAQLTTLGQISFELNIEVVDTAGHLINYVSNDSVLLPNEVLNRYLKYPFEQVCGCPDPDYLEYIADRDCDVLDSCKTMIVFGCTDIMACNYDADANFNIPAICCYPGSCADRDISLVCPSLSSNNRTINIYPNPAQTVVNLYISYTDVDQIHYEVYNAFGKMLKGNYLNTIEGTVNGSLNISAFDNGLYLIRVFIGDELHSKMFMKN